MKGRTLKRQTAIALRCIQALVKVQARSRAKHVLTAVEGQAVQQKLLQQLEHEAPVKKPEVSYHLHITLLDCCGWVEIPKSHADFHINVCHRVMNN